MRNIFHRLGQSYNEETYEEDEGTSLATINSNIQISSLCCRRPFPVSGDLEDVGLHLSPAEVRCEV